jgi:hypothetical protein
MKPEEVLQELAAFVGPEIKKWAFLKDYLLPEALPVVGAFELIKHKAESAGILLAGDYTGFPSLQSALESGRKAVEASLSA